MHRLYFLLAATIFFAANFASAQSTPSDSNYKVIKSVKVGGEGGFDYVFADSDGRRLYIPRSGGANSRVTVFDLDTLQSVGEIANTMGVHGVAVDPKSNHGFSSSKPVVMFDTKSLTSIKNIDVQGSPDGIVFDPASQRVFVFSHRAPNATVINSVDGSIVGTIDLNGAPEQAVSDANGHLYVDLEDKDKVAVVDINSLKVTTQYDLQGKGGGPAGLALDPKNHILFACCRNPHTVVVLNAEDGTIITTLPIGNGVDAAEFNPHTMEAFSSQRDGTMTVIKEANPQNFVVAQNVETKLGAKTSTLDAKTDQIILITAEAATTTGDAQANGQGTKAGRTRWLPDSFTILVVGK